MDIKYGLPKTVQCMHCGADNPPTAYCCLSCFKVMRSKQTQSSFWRMPIHTSSTMIIVVFMLFIGAVLLLKKWISSIDAQISMNFQSADYSLSLMADKKRKKSFLNIESQEPILDADAIDSPPDQSKP